MKEPSNQVTTVDSEIPGCFLARLGYQAQSYTIEQAVVPVTEVENTSHRTVWRQRTVGEQSEIPGLPIQRVSSQAVVHPGELWLDLEWWADGP